MFSFTFLKDVLKEFLYHPSAILKLSQGLNSTNQYLAQQRRKKWLKNHVPQKQTRYFKILLHLHDDNGLSAHIGSDCLYEPAETALMQKILKPNMTFVDVGANIGWYTLL